MLYLISKKIIFRRLFKQLLGITCFILCSTTTLSSQPISVLSWNIKFLPRFIAHIGHYPLKRVKPISMRIQESGADIVILQEAFDRKANRRLINSLNTTFPFTAGPANQKPGLKISSGILILSKTPLVFLGQTEFNDCKGIDCMARKGALLVETVIDSIRLQILGTHLQDGGPLAYKLNQYQQIAGLLRAHEEYGTPQIICGDFNTDRTDTNLYRAMLKILRAEDVQSKGSLLYSYDQGLNDMETYDPNYRKLIDYTLLKANGLPPIQTQREIVRYQYSWHKKHKDLSDHFGLMLELMY